MAHGVQMPPSPPDPLEHSSSMLHQRDEQRLTRDAMKRYLRERERCSMAVVIFHAKVSQKSYPTRKRYFCPPPCISLYGEGWRLRQERMLREGVSEQGVQICALIGTGNSDQDMQQFGTNTQVLNFNNATQYCAAKGLYILGSDKRKDFMLSVKMYHCNGHDIGIFRSNMIKVISCPQTNRFVNKAGQCIDSMSMVALCNTQRSNTLSSHYLHVENGSFRASATQWRAFYIYLLDDNEPESEEFKVLDGPVRYGSTVKLVCCVTGMTFPLLIIRKVEYQRVLLGVADPVLQLHRCAFYLKDTERLYLGLLGEDIKLHQATACSMVPNAEVITEGACWSIVNTEMAEYTLFEGMGPVRSAVTPVPVVHRLDRQMIGDVAMWELYGENLNNLQLWFEDVEVEIISCNSTNMLCVMPEISRLREAWPWVFKSTQVPVSLVRNDGVIYPTTLRFTYIPDPGPRPHFPAADDILGSEAGSRLHAAPPGPPLPPLAPADVPWGEHHPVPP